jgi:hypothetical protein
VAEHEERRASKGKKLTPHSWRSTLTCTVSSRTEVSEILQKVQGHRRRTGCLRRGFRGSATIAELKTVPFRLTTRSSDHRLDTAILVEVVVEGVVVVSDGRNRPGRRPRSAHPIRSKSDSAAAVNSPHREDETFGGRDVGATRMTLNRRAHVTLKEADGGRVGGRDLVGVEGRVEEGGVAVVE